MWNNLYKRDIFRYVQILFGVAFGCISFYLVFQSISLTDLWYVLKVANILLASLAFGTVLISSLLKSYRWKIILRCSGVRSRFFKLFQYILIGHTVNAIYPARFGEISRALYLRKEGVPFVSSLMSIVIEKFLDFNVFGVFIAVLLIIFPFPTWLSHRMLTLLGVLLFVFILVILLSININRFAEKIHKYLQRKSGKIGKWLVSYFDQMISYIHYIDDTKVMIRLLVISFAAWFMAIITNYLVLTALSLDLPLETAFVLLVFLQFGYLIPTLPGKIGAFEAMCVFVLSLFDIPQVESFAYGIVLQMVALIPTTLIGLIFIWFNGLSLKDKNILEVNNK